MTFPGIKYGRQTSYYGELRRPLLCYLPQHKVTQLNKDANTFIVSFVTNLCQDSPTLVSKIILKVLNTVAGTRCLPLRECVHYNLLEIILIFFRRLPCFHLYHTKCVDKCTEEPQVIACELEKDPIEKQLMLKGI